MTRFILDASAMGKRYVSEPGSPLLHYLFDQVAHDRLSCLTIGGLETLAVIVRNRNTGKLSAYAAEQALSNLALEVFFGAVHTIPATDNLVFDAAEFVEKHNINSTDAILLRAALDMQAEAGQHSDRVILVASDGRLLRAADREGLAVFDPESDDLAALQALAQAV